MFAQTYQLPKEFHFVSSLYVQKSCISHVRRRYLMGSVSVSPGTGQNQIFTHVIAGGEDILQILLIATTGQPASPTQCECEGHCDPLVFHDKQETIQFFTCNSLSLYLITFPPEPQCFCYLLFLSYLDLK